MPDPHTGFAPDPDRAALLDLRMHRELAASLTHLGEACRDVLPRESDLLVEVASTIAGGRRVPPLAFSLYFAIGRALLSDDHAVVPALVDRLHAVPDRGAFRVLTHDSPGAAPLFEALADPDTGVFAMAPVAPEAATAFRGLIDDGLALMQRCLPTLLGEIGHIVHEVVLAHSAPGQKMEFDGASHYQFWGLLMLNPKHHKTPLAVVEVLAHEAAHSLLFGLTVDEPLVFNPDEELYASPLRKDPRPMDGIFHATFVSARMAWAMERLAAEPSLSAAERDAARAAAQTDRDNFRMGIDVVDKDGRLSDTGAAIMAGARDFMASHA